MPDKKQQDKKKDDKSGDKKRKKTRAERMRERRAKLRKKLKRIECEIEVTLSLPGRSPFPERVDPGVVAALSQVIEPNDVPRVNVGEQISLEARVVQPKGKEVRLTFWRPPKYPVAVGDYSADHAKGELTSFLSLNTDQAKFYFTQGQEIQSVTLTIEFKDGTTCSRELLFAVDEPVLISYEAVRRRITADANFTAPGTYLHFGVQKQGQEGIQWTATVKTSALGGGQIGFCQLISTDRRYREGNGNRQIKQSQKVLDSKFPYDHAPVPKFIPNDQAGTQSDGDAPGLELGGRANATRASVNEDFQTFVMYRPGNKQKTNIWIPLGVFTWVWCASARLAQGQPVLDNGASSDHSKAVPTRKFPVWSSNIKFTKKAKNPVAPVKCKKPVKAVKPEKLGLDLDDVEPLAESPAPKEAGKKFFVVDEWGETVAGARLGVTVRGGAVAAGTAIDLDVALQNVRLGGPLEVPSSSVTDDLRITVTDRDGQPAPLTAFGRRQAESTGFRRGSSLIGPGRSLIQTVPLSRLFDLSEAGSYVVEVARTVVDGDRGEFVEVRSNFGSLEVRSVDGDTLGDETVV